MPTRNRASLLRSSLGATIHQNFQDYEIVVSDNNSTDDTKQVVEDLMKSSDRIKYVNPGRDLSMCDNWEFVLSHASGRYVVLLCDDDALALNSLSFIHRLLSKFPIEVLGWRYGSYHFPDFPDENRRLMFSYKYASGDLFEVESRPMIEALLRFDWKVNAVVPKMLNCAVSREAIDACRRRTGTFFIPPYPDFSAVGQLLATNRSYHFIDLPLYVSGVSQLSNAAFLFDRRRTFDAYVSLFGHDLLEDVPYQMRYLCNSYFHATWRFFKRTYPEAYQTEVDMESYLKALFTELTRCEEHEDVSEELNLLAGYMREFSGSDEMFQHLRSAQEDANSNGARSNETDHPVQQLKQSTWKALGKNERLFNLVARARGHKIPTFRKKNVPSLEAAAKVLSSYISKFEPRIDTMEPIKVSSPYFLNERR